MASACRKCTRPCALAGTGPVTFGLGRRLVLRFGLLPLLPAPTATRGFTGGPRSRAQARRTVAPHRTAVRHAARARADRCHGTAYSTRSTRRAPLVRGAHQSAFLLPSTRRLRFLVLRRRRRLRLPLRSARCTAGASKPSLHTVPRPRRPHRRLWACASAASACLPLGRTEAPPEWCSGTDSLPKVAAFARRRTRVGHSSSLPLKSCADGRRTREAKTGTDKCEQRYG
jgi:hypothetical protein